LSQSPDAVVFSPSTTPEKNALIAFQAAFHIVETPVRNACSVARKALQAARAIDAMESTSA
jgi:hypothetical protein